MNFKSLPELLDYFKKEETCIAYYEQVRWNGKPICPHCNSGNPYKTNVGYKCSDNRCYKKFNVKSKTMFENSKIPMRIWFAAMYLCTNHKKGISSVQLSEDLGTTQKTAWFVLHRIREMLKDKEPAILGKNGMVEADETFIGGKERNRHTKKKQSDVEDIANDGSKYNHKKVVVGIIERDGKVVLKYIPNATRDNAIPFINKHVPLGSTLYTDESNIYHNLNKIYTHETVNHSLRLYVNGTIHTNTIENFWALLKRGIYGIYHQISDKHVERYLAEFAGRFNERRVSSQARFEKFLSQAEGRLTYKNLIATI